MPRTRSITWAEIKLGVIGVIAVGLSLALLLAVTGDTGLPWQRYSLKVRFDSVKGLEQGAMVRLNGKDVGQVRSLEFADDKIDVILDLTKDVQPLVTTGSTASIGTMGMLGDAAIDLSISKRGAPIQEWGYVKVAPGASTGDLTSLVTDIRAGKGTLGKLVTDRELYENLNHAAAEMRGLMADIRKDPKKFLQMTFRIF